MAATSFGSAWGPEKTTGCVVRLQDELATGTLQGILKQAGVTTDEFIDKL
jgi:hypothetical protein